MNTLIPYLVPCLPLPPPPNTLSVLSWRHSQSSRLLTSPPTPRAHTQCTELEALSELQAADEARASEATQQLAAAELRLVELEDSLLPGLVLRSGLSEARVAALEGELSETRVALASMQQQVSGVWGGEWGNA